MGRGIAAAVRAIGNGTLFALLLGVTLGEAAPPDDDSVDVASVDLWGVTPKPLPMLPVTEPPAVRLLWFDPTHALGPGPTAVIGQEVRAIFRDLGVLVDFTGAGSETIYGGGPVPELAVILLPDDPAAAQRKQRVMGLVVRDQQPSRSIWAFLANVRWTLQHNTRFRVSASSNEEAELGLALGRVVAHEVIHAIAPEEPHSKGGLMSHSLDRGFLLAKRAELDERCSRAFLNRLASKQASTTPSKAPVAALATVRY